MNITKPIYNLTWSNFSFLKDTTLKQTSLIDENKLSDEEINQINITSITNDFKYKTNKEQDYNTFFSFLNENIGVKLDEKNLLRMQDFFDNDNFIKNNKGFILDKSAASFIGSWFNEIAFNQNFLNADTNKDGFLNKAEMLNTFKSTAYNQGNIYERFGEVDYKIASLLGELKNYTSISNALNKVISDDTNFDLRITGKEAYGVSGIARSVDINLNNIDKAKLEELMKKNIEEEYEMLIKLAAILAKAERNDKLSDDDIKVLKAFNMDYQDKINNISKELKINKNDLENIINNDKLDEFGDFLKDFLQDLSKVKLLDIRV